MGDVSSVIGGMVSSLRMGGGASSAVGVSGVTCVRLLGLGLGTGCGGVGLSVGGGVGTDDRGLTGGCGRGFLVGGMASGSTGSDGSMLVFEGLLGGSGRSLDGFFGGGGAFFVSGGDVPCSPASCTDKSKYNVSYNTLRNFNLSCKELHTLCESSV